MMWIVGVEGNEGLEGIVLTQSYAAQRSVTLHCPLPHTGNLKKKQKKTFFNSSTDYLLSNQNYYMSKLLLHLGI